MNNEEFTYQELREKIKELEEENSLLKQFSLINAEKNDNHISAIINAIPDLVFRISIEGIILDYKADIADLYFQKDTIIGKKHSDILPQYFIEIIDKNIQLALETGLLQSFDYHLDIPLKGIRYYEARMIKSGTTEVTIISRDITERKNAEQEIRKLNKAIESSKISIVITDYAGNIIYANPYFTELTGYTKEYFVGKNPNILKTDYHPSEFYSNFWNTIKSGETWEGEFYNRKKNGEYYWEKAIVSPIKDKNDKVTNFVAVKTNVTEQKRSTELILENEKRLSLALKVAKIGYWRYEVATNKVEWSSGHDVLFGISMEEFQQTLDAVQACVHPEDRNYGEQNIIKTIEKNIPFDNTYRVIHPNGNIRWLHSYGYLFHNQNEQPDHIFGITQDITDRKNFEQELIIAKEKAEESEYKVRSMFENTHTGFLFFTPQGQILEANPAVLKILGSPSLELSK